VNITIQALPLFHLAHTTFCITLFTASVGGWCTRC